MKYKIVYHDNGTMHQMNKNRQWMKPLTMLVVLLTVFTVLCYFSGMDWQVTWRALEEMAHELGQGSGMRAAFTSFCLDILQGAA